MRRWGGRVDVGVYLEDYGCEGRGREEHFLMVGDLADVAVTRSVGGLDIVNEEKSIRKLETSCGAWSSVHVCC